MFKGSGRLENAFRFTRTRCGYHTGSKGGIHQRGLHMPLGGICSMVWYCYSSAKRMGELHALSIHPNCCMFLPDDSGIVLCPNPDFWSQGPDRLLLSPINWAAGTVLPSNHPRTYTATLCPVQALTENVLHTGKFGGTDQLFCIF